MHTKDNKAENAEVVERELENAGCRPIVTIKQAAIHVDVDASTLRRAINSGELAGFRNRGLRATWKIHRAALARWMVGL